jgi:hypothetical protein
MVAFYPSFMVLKVNWHMIYLFKGRGQRAEDSIRNDKLKIINLK